MIAFTSGLILGITIVILLRNKPIIPTIVIKKECSGHCAPAPTTELKEETEVPEPINMNGVIEALHAIMGVEHDERR